MSRSARSTAAALALVAALVLSVVGLVGVAPDGAQAASPAAATSPTSARAVYHPTIHFGRCRDVSLRTAGARCAMLSVPLDWSKPGGAKIKIAVSRVLHTRSPYRGVVFTNPGGPGGSGLGLSAFGSYVPRHVGETYDWYGIDPRGVGSSRPALTCDGRYFGFHRPSYRPVDKKSETYWRHKTAGYARDCGRAKARALLPHLRTTDNVADFDALRQAIGAAKITYYGYSYGTYLGEVYATQHPHRVAAMVLDGVIDPTRVWYRSNFDQDVAFQRTIGYFFAWVAEHHGRYHLGTTRRAVAAAYDREVARLTKRADGKVGPDELADVVLNAGYYNGTWPSIAADLSALVLHGRESGIAAEYRAANPVGPGADNLLAVYSATICTDAPWPHSYATYRKDVVGVDRKAPFYTWGNAWFNAACLSWPAKAGRPVHVTGKRLRAPVLLTAEQHDAATPFAGALVTRRLFPSSRLLEGVGGTSHAVTPDGVACTDDAIADLLAHHALPRRKHGSVPDKRCPGLAPPSPGGSGGSGGAGRVVAARPSRPVRAVRCTRGRRCRSRSPAWGRPSS